MSESKQEVKINVIEVNKCELCGQECEHTEDNQCFACRRYICFECQLKHKCGIDHWESVSESRLSPVEKLLNRFSRDLVIALDKDFSELNHMCIGLKEENENLKKQLGELSKSKE